jgi:hypothetical protein
MRYSGATDYLKSIHFQAIKNATKPTFKARPH